jgi:cytochrome P450
MRLYPPAWAVARTVMKDIELGGYRVPKGSNIVISQWVMHRDARFFRDPEKFDPDRWSPERAQEVLKFAYFPFGAGPRGCIGQSFAMMEAILLLATIAQRFQLRVPSDFPVIPTPSVTLRPQNGLRSVLYRR